MFNNSLPVSSLFLQDFAALSTSLSSCTHPLHFLFFCLLCSVRHSHSMHLLSSVHFSCCTPPASSHMHHFPQQQHHLFFLSHSYTPCASCASSLCNGSPFSTCQVLCLIIMATLQLLRLLSPSVHYHWVSRSNSFTSRLVEILHLLLQSTSTSLSQLTLQCSSSCQYPP
jgi:hypothetical protein